MEMPDFSKLNLRAIARATGLSWSMVWRVFSDSVRHRRNPSIKNAKKLANVLGISLDTFYELFVEEE